MRRLLAWATRLYPRSWRTRYGAELEALIDDLDPGWRDVASIVKGSVTMHLESAKRMSLKPLNVTGVAVSCVVALLAFAAADDITTGSEPSHALEWLFLALAAAWFLAAGAWARRKRRPARTSTG